MNDIEKLMKIRAHIAKSEYSPEKQGDLAENIAEKFFDLNGWVYEKVPQKILGRSKTLRDLGGKRPDYIFEVCEEYKKDTVIVGDVKFIEIKDELIKLEESEIKKYNGLIKYLRQEYEVSNAHLLFFIFPKTDDFQTVLLVPLSLFENGSKCKLSNKDALGVSVSSPGIIKRSDIWK